MLTLVICLVLLILKTEAMDTDIGSVILTANSRNLTYVTTNLSINYAGNANYTYEDGEDMYFSCEKAHHVEYLHLRSHSLRLEYYNAEGILLFQTKPRVERPHIFRSVLKSNNDKYCLDCIRTAGNNGRKYIYRTTFYMKKRSFHDDAVHHAMILSVNGHNLTVVTNNSKSSFFYNDYLYRFIDGEILNVTYRKSDKNMRGSIIFYSYHDEIARYISPVVRRPLEGYISLNVSATINMHKKKLLFCINNSNVQKPNARLLFLSDIFENGVHILGLPRHNIMYQYTNDLDKWTFEYQYSVNDTLNLTCVSKGPTFNENQRFQWEFNGETSISAAMLLPTLVIVSNKTFTKILDATHNGKTINCVYIPNSYHRTERVEIILRLKPGTNTGKTLSNVKISAKSSPLILSSSIGAVLIILGLTGVACWYVRTRKTRRNIETPYEDVPYQNNSPTPQCTNEVENQYDVCYSEIPSNREMYYEIPLNVESNADPEDPYYTEIDLMKQNY